MTPPSRSSGCDDGDPDAGPCRSGIGERPATRRALLRACLLTLALALVYLSNLDFLPGNDATPNVDLAARLLEGGGFGVTPSSAPHLFVWVARGDGVERRGRMLDLDRPIGGQTGRALYASGALVPEAPYYLTESVRRDAVTGERVHVGLYGAGAALTALPVLAGVRVVAGDLRRSPAALWYGAKLAAALLAAASAGLLLLTLERFVAPRAALLLALAYGLGTPVWSVSSQALWQHAPNELFIAAGALALCAARGSRRNAALAGLAFAAATACRPTSALYAVAAAAWLGYVDRRSLVAFAAGSLPVAALVAAYNAWFLGSPLRFGQGTAVGVALAKTGSPELWRGDLLTTLAGLLLSPARGLLIYSPFLLLALPGAVLVVRREEYAPLRPLLLGACLVLLVDLAWFDWWGGWSWSWRRLTDLAPVLVLLLAPVVPLLARSRLAATGFAIALAWSIALQAVGAYAYDLDGWNARRAWRVVDASGHAHVVLDEATLPASPLPPGVRVEPVTMDVDLPEYRHRLWSLRDSPIVYYAGDLAGARRARRQAVAEWLAHAGAAR